MKRKLDRDGIDFKFNSIKPILFNYLTIEMTIKNVEVIQNRSLRLSQFPHKYVKRKISDSTDSVCWLDFSISRSSTLNTEYLLQTSHISNIMYLRTIKIEITQRMKTH